VASESLHDRGVTIREGVSVMGIITEGRTVLVSSHLLSEMALTADHLLVIGRGRLIADVSTEQFVNGSGVEAVLVRIAESPDESFVKRLVAAGGQISDNGDDALTVSGLGSAHIGALATSSGVVLSELTPKRASLEQVFMEKTEEYVQYHAEGAQQ
jgi:ABC-2 type transport system ATP-binding protein